MRLIASLILMLWPPCVVAQQRTVGDAFRDVEPSDFANAFIGLCAQNPGRLDKVGSIATAMEWATTPEPFWTMLAPQDPNIPYHSWFATDGEGTPLLLGISEAPMFGKTYQICAVSNPFMGAERALEEVKKFVPLGTPITDESIAGQRIRTWDASALLAGAFLASSDIAGMGAEGVTLSVSAPKQYE
ncbi:hypothetical protein [Thetidibacter halocola]|uniref:Uncharacterized protein n=1 Tax=Thetidibacter halocola TaxID=2827239 RepID=A0A8J7WBW0_9RHOB|nr:hypothetical protein [Thetidibacter halocola]MBS0124685.1 hypothetical protein [Thetidibacter halocola]